MTDALANLNENDRLLRVAFPRARNNATNTPNDATGHATGAQQIGLKALALLALERNKPRNNHATDTPKTTQQTAVLEGSFVARVAQDSDVLRARLLALAEVERIDAGLVRKLPNGDVAECSGLPDETLVAYLRALRDDDLREKGKRIADETAPALCVRCGPIWTAPEVASAAPVVDGWPRVLGCPWCHVANRRAIPRPSVTCGACRHFIRDAVNPRAGWGRCSAGVDPDRPTPMATRSCATFRPQGTAP